MAILFNRLFSPIAFSHLLVDILNGQRGIFLAYLSVPLALSNTAVGLVSTVYMLVAAIIQPLAGWLADRHGPRWLVAGGVIWMGVFFALAVIIPGTAALVFFIIASLGSGLFHPAGSMQSSLIGRTVLQGREGTSASLFFFFGQTGYAIGPLLGGPLLDVWGPPGLLLLAALCLPVGAFGAWELRRAVRVQNLPEMAVHPAANGWQALQGKWGYIAAMLVVATCQSWIQQNMQTFIPKYLSDAGMAVRFYGLQAALFMAGSAVGNVLGGQLGDRRGQRLVITTGLALLVIPLALLPLAGTGAWLSVLIPLSGIFSGAAYTSIFTLSQKIVPGSTGLAAGVALSFMFSSGSIGALVSGQIADHYGFGPVFWMSAGLALIACLVALWLIFRERDSAPDENLQPGYSNS